MDCANIWSKPRIGFGWWSGSEVLVLGKPCILVGNGHRFNWFAQSSRTYISKRLGLDLNSCVYLADGRGGEWRRCQNFPMSVWWVLGVVSTEMAPGMLVRDSVCIVEMSMPKRLEPLWVFIKACCLKSSFPYSEYNAGPPYCMFKSTNVALPSFKVRSSSWSMHANTPIIISSVYM